MNAVWQSIPAYLAGQEHDLPPCENCGRVVDDDGEPVHRDDADWCSDCSWGVGMQHHAMYVDRDRWWAQGGHCLCDECAPPREPDHCNASYHHCAPAEWGCNCDCADCTAVRAS